MSARSWMGESRPPSARNDSDGQAANNSGRHGRRRLKNNRRFYYMTTKIIGDIAVIRSDTPLIVDGQSAIDLIVPVFYEHDITKIAINKEAVSEDFFRLSTGVAGEVMQKFVNYQCHLVVFGDFSGYTSNPLRDYIYECNNGRQLNFAADEDEAIRRLGGTA
jgi:hypothetical protein